MHEIKDNTNYTELFEEFYLIMESLVGEKHINLALLDDFMGEEMREIRQFLILSIVHFKHMLEHVDELP